MMEATLADKVFSQRTMSILSEHGLGNIRVSDQMELTGLKRSLERSMLRALQCNGGLLSHLSSSSGVLYPCNLK